MSDHLAHQIRADVYRAQGFDHAHHRRDDAEGRQGVADFVEGIGRQVGFVFEAFDLVQHQLVKFMGLHGAADQQAQVIGDEQDDQRVSDQSRVLGENRALRGFFDIPFQGEHAFAAGLAQQGIEHGHQFQVQGFVVFGAALET